jgi:hypothetical protein
LDLRANRLSALPGGIRVLPSLEKLDVRWNKLTAAPEWIDDLERRGCAVLL